MRLTILVGTFLTDLLDDHAAAGVEFVEVGPLVRGHAPSSVLIDAPQARVQVPATVITLTRTAGCSCYNRRHSTHLVLRLVIKRDFATQWDSAFVIKQITDPCSSHCTSISRTTGYSEFLLNKENVLATSLNYHLSELQFLQQFKTEIFWNFAEQRTTPCSSPCNRLKPGYFGFMQNNENVYVICLITLRTPVPAIVYIQDIFLCLQKNKNVYVIWLITTPFCWPCNSLKPGYFGFLRNDRNL